MTRRLIPARWHIFIVVAVTFLALLVSAGVRATPGVLLLPLQLQFGWSRATISFGAAVGIFLYGLAGPFAAALMQTVGIRRTMLGGLVLMSGAIFASLWMQTSWQYVLCWGVVSGIGTGAVTSVLGAAVVNRWFATRQGVVMGLLSASTATGSLIFLPALAYIANQFTWRPAVLTVSLACLGLVPLVLLLVPERPADIGALRFGETTASPPQASGARGVGLAFAVLGRAGQRPVFWLLFGTFAVCGLTTNGLVGTHMIAFCGDHGVPPVAAAGLLSLMGLFDLFGTTASGWLTDRFDPRLLLVVYYGLRGLSLMVLPFLPFTPADLGIFAVFYGLDWIATVPPTVKLANRAFGEQDGPIVFGWVQTGHQFGAALAAFGAGLVRQHLGTYLPAFVGAGAMGVIAALVLALSLARAQGPRVAR
ncbi:MFS transporter [Acidocella sp.]|uniref:MFS transporter n=1 Tax=Acidocella sp. TaxID=50710 RepID=UPI00261CCACF|nr:MFS transporter [Acidocella sp.]